MNPELARQTLARFLGRHVRSSESHDFKRGALALAKDMDIYLEALTERDPDDSEMGEAA